MRVAYRIVWTESERGMGQRPDGVSLHETFEIAERFKKWYSSQGNAEIYSFGSDIKLVEISEEDYQHLIKNGKNGSTWKDNNWRGIRG
jgi:phage anti-repressor protein